MGVLVKPPRHIRRQYGSVIANCAMNVNKF